MLGFTFTSQERDKEKERERERERNEEELREKEKRVRGGDNMYSESNSLHHTLINETLRQEARAI